MHFVEAPQNSGSVDNHSSTDEMAKILLNGVKYNSTKVRKPWWFSPQTNWIDLDAVIYASQIFWPDTPHGMKLRRGTISFVQ
jgi:hypothetical protein